MAWKTCEYCNGVPPKNGCPNYFITGGHEVKEKTTSRTLLCRRRVPDVC